MKIVVALGGNALVLRGQGVSVINEFREAQKAMAHVAGLVALGHKIAITHGNGPQVGELMLGHEIAGEKVPLEVSVAESQGQIGYVLSQSLQNAFSKKNVSMGVAVVLTQVLVDKKDRAFKRPSKPVGPFYSKRQALALKKKGVRMIEDAGRGYRRVVASPVPQKIIERQAISKLFEEGVIVIACGGGGIPVVESGGKISGVPAVIDKDLASALLALEISADVLLIVTSVDFVCLDFGGENEEQVFKMNVPLAKKFFRQGHFLEGSMGPKIGAAIKFLQGGGKKVIICSVEKMFDALHGKSGTWIVK
ncbi:MAG: carbamate kinase [archaeon]